MMTKVYLIRHGIAANREDYAEDDTQRPLTVEGVQKTGKIARRLRELGLQFDLILSSPLLRARQTAEVLQAAGLSAQLELSPHLAPEGTLSDWWSDRRNWRDYPSLALVGHEPNLGHWTEMLVWGEVQSRLVVKKASIIGVSLPESGSPMGRSNLFLLAPPRFLL